MGFNRGGTGGSTVFSGDLSGSDAGPQTVVGIEGRPAAATAPTMGQGLVWNGTHWAPATVGSGFPLTYDDGTYTYTITATGGSLTVSVTDDATGNLLSQQTLNLAAGASTAETQVDTQTRLTSFTPVASDTSPNEIAIWNSTAAGQWNMYAGLGSPNGVQTALKGSVWFDLSTPAIWINNNGATGWTSVAGGIDPLPFNVMAYGANPNAVERLIGVVTTVIGNLFTYAAHGLTNGDSVVLTSITTTTGITTFTTYYVINATANTFQLSATVGGASVTLATGNGTCNATCAFAAALTANNTAFANAWAAARAANGTLFIPAGIYSIGPGIITTNTNDAGILGENLPQTLLYLVDTTNTGIAVYQRLTNPAAWAGLIPPGTPAITGFIIDGTFAGTGSIGLKIGCMHHAYHDVTVRYFQGTGGANGVTGLTGAIGILVQNAVDTNAVAHEYEECCLGPRTRIDFCTNGIVFDKNGIASPGQSFGYATFLFLFTKNCANHIVITNGAWLYAGDFNLAGNNTGGGPATPNIVQVINGSRLTGHLNWHYESDDAGTTPVLVTVDATSIWATEGLIDDTSFAFTLPTNAITPGGVFNHVGVAAIFALPSQSNGWISHAPFEAPNRTAGSSNNVSTFTVRGNFTQRYQQGVRVRWTESGTVKYGVVAIPSTLAAGVTTVTLAPTTDYWMAVSPDVGSLLYSNANPADYPTWFNYTPTLTGYSAIPTGLVYQYKVDGSSVTYQGHDGANGTSNAASLTATLPITCATVAGLIAEGACNVVDNAVLTTTPGFWEIPSNGTTIQFGLNSAGVGGFTATGGKRVRGFEAIYPI